MSETQNISGCFPLRPTTTSQLGHVWIKSLKSSKHSETMQQGIQPAKKSKIKIMNIINTPGPRIIRFLGLEKSLINTSFLTDSYIGFTLKMESVPKNTILGLKMMVRSSLEIFVKKSIPAEI